MYLCGGQCWVTVRGCSRSQVFGVRFEYCIWIGVNPRVVVAPFARRHLWCICAAVSVGSQCVVARVPRFSVYDSNTVFG